jgi:hypothetical protein
MLLGAAAPTGNIPLEILRSIFGTALIFFNPVNTQNVLDLYSVQLGLLLENYFMGSLVGPVEFVALEKWTAEAYAAMMAALLLSGWGAIIWAMKTAKPRERGLSPPQTSWG